MNRRHFLATLPVAVAGVALTDPTALLAGSVPNGTVLRPHQTVVINGQVCWVVSHDGAHGHPGPMVIGIGEHQAIAYCPHCSTVRRIA